LQQLLARGLLVPLAVATEAFEQLGDGFLLLAGCRQRHGVVYAGLVVGRVGFDLGLQFGGVARFSGHTREVKRGTGTGDGCGVCLVGGYQVDGLLGAADVAALEVTLGEAGECCNVLWVFLEHAGIYFRCALQVARLERLIRRLDGGRCVGGSLLAQQPFDKRLHRALWLGTHKTVERAAVAKGIDGGDRLDAQLVGEGLVLIDIDLYQPHLALMRTYDLLEDGGELLAGPAPGSPKIDQHRHLSRGLEHVLGEARHGRVLDEVTGHFLRATARLAQSEHHYSSPRPLPAMGVFCFVRRLPNRGPLNRCPLVRSR